MEGAEPRFKGRAARLRSLPSAHPRLLLALSLPRLEGVPEDLREAGRGQPESLRHGRHSRVMLCVPVTTGLG